ncbi:DNA-damage-inducible transcript 4 [Columba livia]|uniref:DNA damage-inducible transcript 4 protein n=1 Tax=Columba livia TaxID=8932 RepID=A0A2I0LX75_COLLI|nr:DNA-damage-inducible transcript 4 [Columba livia]
MGQRHPGDPQRHRVGFVTRSSERELVSGMWRRDQARHTNAACTAPLPQFHPRPLGSVFAHVPSSPLPGADLPPVLPTDADYADGASLPDLDLLHDPEDELLCSNLMDLVQATLGRAPLGAKRCSRLLMPAQLLVQVRTELLRLACSEPCGLRGALLDLCVEHGKACHDVGHITVDPAVVPTFQLCPPASGPRSRDSLPRGRRSRR